MRSFLRGFGYAARGFAIAVRQERNMRFHLCAAAYVYLFSLFYNFSNIQYALLTVLVVGVLALELINSALERAVDRPNPNRYPSAGAVKDIAAAAVLVFAAGAAVCGVLLFWDVAVFKAILFFFSGHLWLAALLLGSIIGAYWFIFRCWRS